MTAVRSSHMPSLEPLTDAEHELVMANLGLIGFALSRFCGRYIGDGYTDDDAWQDGYLGLCAAVHNYDPARGALSTYAMDRIRNAIQRGKGTHSGVSYRQGHPAKAVSIDALLEAGTEVAEASAPDDFTVDVDFADLLDRIRATCCRDALDRDVLAFRLASVSPRPCEALADAHGVTRQTILNRQTRLLAELRRQLARVGAT